VIGGSGLYALNDLRVVKQINPETPWGFPSSPITITQLPSGVHLAFISRHGVAHEIPPSSVPSRANIAALKHIGVKAILAFSAVGSLREEIRPGDFVIPHQIIDRTKGNRQASFFEGTSIVAHAMFGDPFDNKFTAVVEPLVKKVLEKDSTSTVKFHTGKTVVCMEGPQFSTRAESSMYRAWGGDIINMSVLPEAKLAREAEMSYTLIATSTDYDAWRVGKSPVTVGEVGKMLAINASTARQVTRSILEDLHEAVLNGNATSDATGSMQHAVVTQRNAQRDQDRKKLSYILPAYFSEEKN